MSQWITLDVERLLHVDRGRDAIACDRHFLGAGGGTLLLKLSDDTMKEMTMTDDEDIRDAALFRLWIRLCEKTASRVAVALADCIKPEEYREALAKLAQEDGLNLPPRKRRLSDPCPYPDQPGWTMTDCWAAQRCACADGVRLGYKPRPAIASAHGQSPGE